MLCAFLLSLAASASVALEYRTELAPVEDSVLEEAAKASSLLIELEDRPPDTLYGLHRRAQQDVERIERALRSSGYYDGEVSILVDGRPADAPIAADGEPGSETAIPVRIELQPGTLYSLREVKVTGGDALPTKLQPELAPEAPARAADIMTERDRLLNAVLAQGYPFASVTLEPASRMNKVKAGTAGWGSTP